MELWNRFLDWRNAPPAAGYAMADEAVRAVAERHVKCRAIDEQIVALREQKKTLSLEIADIEQTELAKRPPNPKGVMTIGR